MGWATLEASANRVAFNRLGSVSVTAGAASGRGFLKMNSEVVLGGEVTVIDYMLEVLTADFGNLAYGQSITVGGESYKVEMQPQRFDTGMWCRIPLMKVVAAVVTANNITTLSGLRLTTLDGRYLVTL
jgi:hypothetical protein